MAKHIHIYMPKAALGIRTDDAATVVPGQVRVLFGGRKLGKSLVVQAFRDAGFDEGKVKRDGGGKFSSIGAASAQQHTLRAKEHQAAAKKDPAREKLHQEAAHHHLAAATSHTEANSAGHAEGARGRAMATKNHENHAANAARADRLVRESLNKSTNRDIGKFSSAQHTAAAEEHEEKKKEHGEGYANLNNSANKRQNHGAAAHAHGQAAEAHKAAAYMIDKNKEKPHTAPTAHNASKAAHAASEKANIGPPKQTDREIGKEIEGAHKKEDAAKKP